MMMLQCQGVVSCCGVQPFPCPSKLSSMSEGLQHIAYQRQSSHDWSVASHVCSICSQLLAPQRSWQLSATPNTRFAASPGSTQAQGLPCMHSSKLGSVDGCRKGSMQLLICDTAIGTAL